MKQIMNTTRNNDATKSVRTYQRLQKAGLILAAISSTVLALPLSMHQLLITVATIIGAVGSLLVTVAKVLDKDLPSSSTTDKSAFTWQGLRTKNNVDKKAAL